MAYQHGYGGGYPPENNGYSGYPGQQYPSQNYNSDSYRPENQGYDQQFQTQEHHYNQLPPQQNYPDQPYSEYHHQGNRVKPQDSVSQYPGNEHGNFDSQEGEKDGDGERGLKEVFYKQHVDQYGQEHNEFRTGRALLATAALGAVAFGIKKAMDKKKEKEFIMQQDQIGGYTNASMPGFFQDDNKSHKSGYAPSNFAPGYPPQNPGPYGGH
ncbi:hypothetical protein GGI25_002308 [Coemansia spiralis]|uniref:Uncharacterized protein n=2 Tax=Coemansia TaxID=4863 RepID=A0A9W8G8M3_9FUNG|nr:hypothetical protein BX070DRAFT_79821 [Coemansia spiralis]KAJ1995295.1 hypothetical protein EDC05_001133 [Coemansia umbellata]KAJ2625696.1 hypothetical protein GGI26_000496 [Coemansia sp. RSA 1358]KAJ2678514.1 hypothetical protein GGI25_002308 [Coemansia spiralis]